MSTEHLVALAVLLFVLSVLCEPLAARLRLPHSGLLVLVGALVAVLLTQGLGLDTGLRASNFADLVFFLFLPVLVFEAAYKLDTRALTDNLPGILLLAVPGVVLAAAICAGLLYLGIGHSSGFPFIAALLAAAVLAATDHVAVVATLKSLDAPERLTMLLEGESLFNDATGVVLFSLVLAAALHPEIPVTVLGVTLEFLLVLGGGILVGLAVGSFGSLLVTRLQDPVLHTMITLSAAYGSFLLAESTLQVSGVVATLVSGLVMARTIQRADSGFARVEIDFLWTVLAYAANGALFLLMGMTIVPAMFSERWLAMLLAIGATFVARVVSVFGIVGLLNLVLRQPVPMSQQQVVVWGGLRGAVALALALSLPVELPYWWTIQSMAFGVVLFNLLVQAPSTPWLLRRLTAPAGRTQSPETGQQT